MTDRNPQHHQNHLLNHDTAQQLLTDYSGGELSLAADWLNTHDLGSFVTIGEHEIRMSTAQVPPAVVALMRAWFETLDRAACPPWCMQHEKGSNVHYGQSRGSDYALAWLQTPFGEETIGPEVGIELHDGEDRSVHFVTVEDAQQLSEALTLAVGEVPA